MIDTNELRVLVIYLPDDDRKPFMDAIDRLEAAEKERDAAELMSLALRAKIAEMEKQPPICRIKDIRRAHYMTKVVGLDPEAWLYALPGAQTQGEGK